MTPAILDTMKVTLEQNGVIFICERFKNQIQRIHASVWEGRDDGKEEKENILPELEEGDVNLLILNQNNILLNHQHVLVRLR